MHPLLAALVFCYLALITSLKLCPTSLLWCCLVWFGLCFVLNNVLVAKVGRYGLDGWTTEWVTAVWTAGLKKQLTDEDLISGLLGATLLSCQHLIIVSVNNLNLGREATLGTSADEMWGEVTMLGVRLPFPGTLTGSRDGPAQVCWNLT